MPAVFVVIATAAPALAQETTYDPATFPFAHRFGLSLGSYFQIFNSSAGYSSDTNDGEIDLENESGLPRRRDNLRLEGYFRVGRRHRIDFGGYYWNRSATRSLDKAIEWDDVVYDVGAELSTSFNTQVYKLAYKYSIVQNESVELMVSGGVSAFSNQVEFAGDARVIGPDGEPIGDASFEYRKTHKVLPVPVIGVACDFAFSRSLISRGSVEYFTYSTGSWDAALTDARVSLDWMPWDHWGFGLGYNYVGLAGHIDRSSHRFRLTYSYDGAIAYVTMRY